MSSSIKVSALVRYLKSKLESDGNLTNIIVSGEISNFTNHRSGHWYFSLKDETARMNCVMFQTYASRSKYIPKDGDKVLIRCSVSMFEASGSIQLYVNAIKLDGIGDLYAEYERLLQKCNSLGLFNADHKKALPKYPSHIAVVTGNNTAALQDVLTTIKRRWTLCDVTLFPVLVQGDESSKQVIDALKKADKMNFDVILLVRGGGSIEDLWSFNSEDLAHVIYDLNTPIVTGVGHETDTTIADYVADVRAATPTAAATLATPDRNDVIKHLENLKTIMVNDVQNVLDSKKLILDYNSEKLLKVKNTYNDKEKELNLIIKKLMIMNHQHSIKYQNELILIKQKMISLIENKINDNQLTLQSDKERLEISLENYSKQLKNNLLHKIELLDAYSPLKILERGYSITSLNGESINSIDKVNEKDHLSIRLNDGMVETEVISKEKFHG